MDGGSSEASDARFAAYVEALGGALGHADRRQPMHDYCLGLLMPIERKSVEPLAAVTAPGQVAAKHQSLLHFIGNAAWSDAAMLAKVGELVLPAIERSGPIADWIIDDTGFPKTSACAPGTRPLPARPGKGIWRPPKLLRRDAQQGADCQSAGRSLANHHVARGHRGLALLAFCTAARAAGASRYLAERGARRRMAADRVAGRGSRADQVLACHFDRGHHLRAFGGCRQVAMADRARLPVAQTRARPG